MLAESVLNPFDLRDAAYIAQRLKRRLDFLPAKQSGWVCFVKWPPAPTTQNVGLKSSFLVVPWLDRPSSLCGSFARRMTNTAAPASGGPDNTCESCFVGGFRSAVLLRVRCAKGGRDGEVRAKSDTPPGHYAFDHVRHPPFCWRQSQLTEHRSKTTPSPSVTDEASNGKGIERRLNLSVTAL